MQAGKLKQRITIKSPNEASDGMGGRTAGTTTLGVFWGAIEPMKGKKLERAQQIDAQASVLITLRHNANIKPDCTAEHGGQKYRILSVINTNSADKTTELYCSALMSERTTA